MKRIIAVVCLAALLMCAWAFAEEAAEYEALAKGSRGEAVKALQERLKELGFYTGKVDGDYGKGTLRAVTAFESRNGLAADGAADTVSVTMEAVAEPAAEETAAMEGTPEDAVSEEEAPEDAQ